MEALNLQDKASYFVNGQQVIDAIYNLLEQAIQKPLGDKPLT